MWRLDLSVIGFLAKPIGFFCFIFFTANSYAASPYSAARCSWPVPPYPVVFTNPVLSLAIFSSILEFTTCSSPTIFCTHFMHLRVSYLANPESASISHSNLPYFRSPLRRLTVFVEGLQPITTAVQSGFRGATSRPGRTWLTLIFMQ